MRSYSTLNPHANPSPVVSSSGFSNLPCLSIISTPPGDPLPRTTTPIGSPPPPDIRRHLSRPPSILSPARSNFSNETNYPASSSRSPGCHQEEALQSSTKAVHDSKSLSGRFDSSNLQVSPSSKAVSTDPYADLYSDYERLASQPMLFPTLPPRIADWSGPCSTASFQRNQLASSFVFTNVGNEEEVKAVTGQGETTYVSNRMGVGCKGINEKEAAELLLFELTLRSNRIDQVYDEVEQDKNEEEGRFDLVDWNEADFAEDSRVELVSSSPRSRRPPDPPPPLLLRSHSLLS
ncbi:uncharacterized protein JCM6883_004004 [Sporobolomyces salmoneus]|uniref:uncharacterized protein n=1 Tax=Sporobolomyces salmoneus TaxID=183962 RepID=UPI0031753111